MFLKLNPIPKKNPQIPTCLLLDRSGSMQSNWDETISALNDLIKSEKKDSSDTHILIATFDSRNHFETIRNTLASKCDPIDEEEISPRGMTPLYDAIGTLNSYIKEEKLDKCQIFILTDGLENCSTEYDVKAIKSIINDWKQKEYNFSFLGADIDAVTEGSKINIDKSQSLKFKKGKEKSVINLISKATAQYRSSGQLKSYSSKERRAVM